MTEPIISPESTFRSLTRIEFKQDQILENQGEMKKDHAKLESRMTAVETRQNKVAGALAVGVFAITFFGGKLREVMFG